MNDTFKLCPIGVIRKRGRAHHVVVSDRFVDGLLGLEGFSHAILLYWFQASDTKPLRSTLRVHPGETRKTRSRACSRPVRREDPTRSLFSYPDPRPERQSNRDRPDRRLRRHSGDRHQAVHSRWRFLPGCRRPGVGEAHPAKEEPHAKPALRYRRGAKTPRNKKNSLGQKIFVLLKT